LVDPHPGNIFILEDGNIGLIDFGQVKQLSPKYRETIAKIVIALDERDNVTNDPEYYEQLTGYMSDLGVVFRNDARQEAAAALALWLFDGSVEQLPGGYDTSELSPNSPVKEIDVFPQDLVLVARSSILIKAFSNRFGISWSLASQWAPVAREILYGKPSKENKAVRNGDKLAQSWKNIKQRGRTVGSRILQKVPLRLKARVASFFV
jgi:aarF domain-containing kinase